ncbi:MAG: hypothetical protein ABI723_06000, partial [Bacteroidia bacterium]
VSATIGAKNHPGSYPSSPIFVRQPCVPSVPFAPSVTELLEVNNILAPACNSELQFALKIN